MAGAALADLDRDGAPSVRRVLWRLLRRTFDAVGVDFADCARIDGDTAIVVIAPATVPADVLVDPLLPVLRRWLDARNRRSPRRLRLRAAVHTGAPGAAGPEVRHALRLAASPTVHAAASADDLAFVASQPLFDDVIRRGVGPADPSAYHRIAVAGHDGASAACAWLAPPITVPRRGRVTSPAGRPPAAGRGTPGAVHAPHGGGAWTAGGHPFAGAATGGDPRVTVRAGGDAPGGRAALGFFGNVSFGGDAVAGDKIVYM